MINKLSSKKNRKKAQREEANQRQVVPVENTSAQINGLVNAQVEEKKYLLIVPYQVDKREYFQNSMRRLIKLPLQDNINGNLTFTKKNLARI